MPDLLALPLRRFQPKRYRPGNLGTWSGHLPFANDLIWSQSPELFVELGTHYGESYFGFCQAVKESGAATRCVAVDTWSGDEHAGFYGEEVYQEVLTYNQSEYESFSTLLRDTFDAASEQFAPESIDLLHLDGLHTQEAVKHDLEVWLPKMKSGGIVLLHDISVKHADFEVWRLWEELSKNYRHFEFRHCWGLGILQKPGGRAHLNDFLQLIFEADAPTAELIRTQYSDAAELLEHRQRSPRQAQAAADADRPYLQVFPGMRETGFKEKESVLSNIQPDNWQRHILDLPQGASNGWIRIDPVNRAALIEVSKIALHDAETGTVLEWNTLPQLAQLRCERHMMPLPSANAAQFFSWGHDPQWILPVPADIGTNSPLQIEILMQVKFELEPVHKALVHDVELRSEIERLNQVLDEAEVRHEHVSRFLGDLRAEVQSQNNLRT